MKIHIINDFKIKLLYKFCFIFLIYKIKNTIKKTKTDNKILKLTPIIYDKTPRKNSGNVFGFVPFSITYLVIFK